MDFPVLLYRCPGPHFAHSGQTYEYARVDDEAALDVRRKAGWHGSLVEAVAAVTAERHDLQSDHYQDDDGAVTRAELEEMAERLGLKFDGRTTDAALLRKIQAATAGGE